jgi:hypothetical protein
MLMSCSTLGLRICLHRIQPAFSQLSPVGSAFQKIMTAPSHQGLVHPLHPNSAGSLGYPNRILLKLASAAGISFSHRHKNTDNLVADITPSGKSALAETFKRKGQALLVEYFLRLMSD